MVISIQQNSKVPKNLFNDDKHDFSSLVSSSFKKSAKIKTPLKNQPDPSLNGAIIMGPSAPYADRVYDEFGQKNVLFHRRVTGVLWKKYIFNFSNKFTEYCVLIDVKKSLTEESSITASSACSFIEVNVRNLDSGWWKLRTYNNIVI